MRTRLLAGGVACALLLTPYVANAEQPDRPATVRAAAAPTRIHDLGLTGAPNARDLGGYRTKDGGRVRHGLVFRSDDLSELTKHDKAVVDRLGLRRVIDLRTPEEAAGAPTPAIPGATYTNVSIAPPGDLLLHAWDDAKTTKELRAATDALGGPDGMYRQIQHELVTTYGVSQLGKVFRKILGTDGPVLFHCTSGQDRTGLTAYTLLRVLGVGRADAMRDYLASNVYGNEEHRGTIEFWESMGYSEHRARLGTLVSRKLLHITLDQVTSVYGSFHGFVRYGLGLSGEDVRELRKTYVTH